MSDLSEVKPAIEQFDLIEYACISSDDLRDMEDVKPNIDNIAVLNQLSNVTKDPPNTNEIPIMEKQGNPQDKAIADMRAEIQRLNQNQNLILSKLTQIMENQEELMGMVAGNSDLLQKNYEKFCKKPYFLKFPIKTEQELQEMNEILLSDKREETITFMSNMLAIGGLQSNFSKIMDSNLIVQYNYDGARGKQALKEYGSFVDAIFEATYQDGRSKKDMISELRRVFKTVKNRVHKQQWRVKKSTNSDETNDPDGSNFPAPSHNFFKRKET